MATDHLEDPSYARLTTDDFLDLLPRHGLGWDHEAQTGAVFHLASAIGGTGIVGLTAVGDSRWAHGRLRPGARRAGRRGGSARVARNRLHACSPGRVQYRPRRLRTRRRSRMAVREAEPVGSLQEVKEAGLDREDLLGIYRNMLTTRGIEERGHILYKQGKIPGSFYTGRGNEGVGGRRRNRDGAERRRHAAPARHGCPRRAWSRALADLRPVHGSRRRPDPWPRRERPHRRRPARAPRDGQPPARDASGRRRDGSRVPDPRGAPRRGRLVRRGRLGARRRARGHELRRCPPAAGRVRDRQQPVGVLDAELPRLRLRASRRPRRRLRVRRRRRRRHRRARRLPRGEARDREGPRGRRPDADRVA